MVERISVSLESKLLRRFDELIEGEGYNTRSEAIRDLIRDALVGREWAKGTKTTMGVSVLVYDHHTMELSQKLTDLQHRESACIIGSLHVHMDQHNCLGHHHRGGCSLRYAAGRRSHQGQAPTNPSRRRRS